MKKQQASTTTTVKEYSPLAVAAGIGSMLGWTLSDDSRLAKGTRADNWTSRDRFWRANFCNRFRIAVYWTDIKSIWLDPFI